MDAGSVSRLKCAVEENREQCELQTRLLDEFRAALKLYFAQASAFRRDAHTAKLGLAAAVIQSRVAIANCDKHLAGILNGPARGS